MDDIARTSDYSKSTIYSYFKSKDDIYYTIVYDYMVLLRDKLGKIISGNEDPEKCYYSLCDALVEFEQRYPMYFDCILGKISVDTKDFEELPVLKDIYDTGEETNELVISFFNRAVSQGVIKEDIPLLPTVFFFWSGICSLISISANKEDYLKQRIQMNREEFLHYGFEMLLNSVRKGG